MMSRELNEALSQAWAADETMAYAYALMAGFEVALNPVTNRLFVQVALDWDGNLALEG